MATQIKDKRRQQIVIQALDLSKLTPPGLERLASGRTVPL